MGGDNSELLVVVGPTASGKSALALRLAEELGGEIISADSVQIYRHFDIGSGKPTADDLARVPHHLIDQVEPTQPIDASQFAKLAAAAIEDVRARGAVPVLCGGTFLWVRALLYGLVPAPPKDDALRTSHKAWAERCGRAALHGALANVDPASAARLNPNDFVRVSRALEVFTLTGKPLSQLQQNHGFKDPRYRFRLVGIRFTPDQLGERIRARVEVMLERGWEAEVDRLVQMGFADVRPMSSVGYRQVLASRRAPLCDSRQALVDDITRVTRVFARRQRTWLREEPVDWLAPEQAENADVSRTLRLR